MDRRSFIGLSLAALASGPALAADAVRLPAGIGLGAAINKAGRQRMLSQRMAKAYALLLDGIVPDKARSLLDRSRSLFEQQLVDLHGQMPNDAIQRALAELAAAWPTYRDVLQQPASRDNARLVLIESEKTLRLAHALTGLYEKQAGTNAGHLVNLSGRQRMLSQRMAKCFLFEQSGITGSNLRDELAKARQEFVAALRELNAASENSADIRADLDLANTQWLFFEQAIDGQERDRAIAARNVATTSERILEVMDSLTGRYERLVRA